MTQSITAPRFPYITAHFSIGTATTIEFEYDLELLVDTGFSGGVAVPRNLIPATVMAEAFPEWRLADGAEIMAPAYTGYVTIGSFPPVLTTIIALRDSRLLGRAVTNNFRVTFDHGRDVIVES